jgi:hypothetical protein
LIKPRVSRCQLVALIAELRPCVIGMEAWALRLRQRRCCLARHDIVQIKREIAGTIYSPITVVGRRTGGLEISGVERVLLNERFDTFALPRPHANVRQMMGRPGEVWLSESGTGHLLRYQSGAASAGSN